MADVFTQEKRSEVMSLIRSTGNKGTELKLVTLMRGLGITGWRRHVPLKAGGTGRRALVKVKPDFVFRAQRVAVFVDGCFWHGCPRHGTRPRQNREFWEAKITRNIARDRKVARALRREGWAVLRMWECALTKKRAPATMARLERALGTD
ncbi:MAG: mismatch repair protein Vsr [Verrucomicrobiaceae bacterium]|nr:mismatch repair protein Vsr [Verrucomicrobiaceae bacterium]